MAHAFEWGKLLKCHLKDKTCRKWANGLKVGNSEKNWTPGVGLPPPRGNQGSHRLEKYLKMKGCLEKYLKTKFALKSAGKLAIGLEKHLNFTSSGIPDNKIRFQNQM